MLEAPQGVFSPAPEPVGLDARRGAEFPSGPRPTARRISALDQLDARETALADLEHVRPADVDGERPIADALAVEPHGALIDEPKRLGRALHEPRALQEMRDAERLAVDSKPLQRNVVRHR